MTVQTDPLVRVEAIALADGHSRRRIPTLPQHDALIPNHGGQPSKGWKVSTLRAWNPAVADRCAAIMHAMENIHLDAA